MPGYISEFSPVGDTSQEFIEVALPAGTDPTGYSIYVYDNAGNALYSFALGTATGTKGGQDVYVINATTPGYDDGGADPTGRLYPDDGIALVDGSGTTLQFISYYGNTVTANNGPAAGQTSTETGTPGAGQSLQSDDGGASYYTQSAPNAGTIPACYASGSLIATPRGNRPIETLTIGDLVLTANGAARPIRWVWSGDQPLDDLEEHQKPVLIKQDALGPARPARDLIVSGQHRIVAGKFSQLEHAFDRPCFVPAKALTKCPRIRFMSGKRAIRWHHILCDDHSIVFANGLASETLLPGPMMHPIFRPRDVRKLTDTLQAVLKSSGALPTALPCLTVRQARNVLKTHHSHSSRPLRPPTGATKAMPLKNERQPATKPLHHSG